MEQRSDVRKAVRLPAVVYSNRFTRLNGEVCDLSAGGLYICAETVIVPIGASVNVTFEVMHPRPDVFELPGMVRHQSLHGFGIAFDGLDEEVRSRLAAFLTAMPEDRRSAAPSVLRSANIAAGY